MATGASSVGTDSKQRFKVLSYSSHLVEASWEYLLRIILTCSDVGGVFFSIKPQTKVLLLWLLDQYFYDSEQFGDIIWKQLNKRKLSYKNKH